MTRLQDGSVVLLDVRPEVEYGLGHLPGALNIPLRKLEMRLSELPRDQEIVAYCRGPYCVLSFEAVAALRSWGFTVRRVVGRRDHASARRSWLTTSSTSCCVVWRPRLNRIAPMPTSGATSIACSTDDSVTRPLWQADPVEAATSGIAERISAPTRPTNDTFSVFGRRRVG